MTKSIPTLTIDSLATATIAFYITCDPNSAELIDALRRFTDAELASMTISELDENELIFDLFIDHSIDYDDNNIDAITNAEFHHTDDFRAMIERAYADARRMNFRDPK